MVQRLTYRRRLAYNTASNARKIVKTPGGKLVYQHQHKLASVPKCGDTGNVLRGIQCARPRKLAQMSKRTKTVTRAYGGTVWLGSAQSHHPRLPDRGAEDCCQGPQGEGG